MSDVFEKLYRPGENGKKESKGRASNRIKRERLRRRIRKALSVVRVGLDTYLAVKSRNPLYIGNSLISAYEAADGFLDRHEDSDEEFGIEDWLVENGYHSPFSGEQSIILGLIDLVKLPYKVMILDNIDERLAAGDKKYEVRRYNTVEGIDMYIEYDTQTPFYSDIYIKNTIDDFYETLGKISFSTLGMCISIGFERVDKYSDFLNLESYNKETSCYIEPEFFSGYLKESDAFFKKGTNRSAIFFGKPGTGKTTLAFKLAEATKKRLLVCDARFIQVVASEGFNIERVLKVLCPDIILFDDIDRVSKQDLDFLLMTMEKVAAWNGKSPLLFIATVNDLQKLPTALRRPGRFDRILQFKDIDADVRKLVLKKYTDFYDVRVKDSYLDDIAEVTSQFSIAHLREIALQLSIKSYDEVYPSFIEEMKETMFLQEEEEEEDD